MTSTCQRETTNFRISECKERPKVHEHVSRRVGIGIVEESDV
jgi:hypothetical protein